jgi:hypothetical protein
MNFLFITAQHEYVNDNKLDKISTLSSIYSFFFKKYLELNGYIVTCINVPNKETIIPEADYCFITYNRGTTKIYPDAYDNLRKKIKKHIITICETNKYIGKEDILIHYAGKRKSKCLKIHWMADPSILFPQKDPNRITVLVDHIYYGNKNSRIYLCDKSRFTIQSLLEFRKNYLKKPIDIYHISSNGINIINTIDDVKDFKQGFAINYLDITKYYNTCDIFVNTHHESMGLTNLECAMTGALIVTFDDFMKNDFLSLIHHYKVTNNDIDWIDIINHINIDKSLKKVKNFTYENGVNELINYIQKNDIVNDFTNDDINDDVANDNITNIDTDNKDM